ncbi:MAG: hypothetical protein CMM30_09880 [Rhodospirillaceae bacterium]|nr:hypothetical protein [Rhodospirillaceae bacterium]|tara:strand:- start:252 stop:659 length:408 start_codon:yes stop_codon:yes gene_type:complete
MLGEKVGTFTGTVMNKALASKGHGLPSIETRATCQGKLAGIDVTSEATYYADMKSDGSWLGECPNSGIIFCSDGVATFRANGIGRMTDDGGVSFRGLVSFEVSSPSLSTLSGKAHMFTWEVDADGKATWEIWVCA